MALTDSKVRTARLKAGESVKKLAAGGSLFLLLNKSGKYWKLKYRFGGKEKSLSIGVYPKTKLKQTVKARYQAKELLGQGIDPSHQKKQDKREEKAKEQALTFEALAAVWLIKRCNNLAPSTKQHREATQRGNTERQHYASTYFLG